MPLTHTDTVSMCRHNTRSPGGQVYNAPAHEDENGNNGTLDLVTLPEVLNYPTRLLSENVQVTVWTVAFNSDPWIPIMK